MSAPAYADFGGGAAHGVALGHDQSIDKAYLAHTIKPVSPQTLEGIRYLGVDEVARAKGQDYLTLVYDLSPGANCGRILWIKEGAIARCR